MPVCHNTCWSLCEKRFRGTLARPPSQSAFVVGAIKGPTLWTSAEAALLEELLHLGQGGVQPVLPAVADRGRDRQHLRGRMARFARAPEYRV